jgi:SecD/SecF fusion protein
MNARGATLLSGLTSLNVPDPATGLQRRLAIILNGEIMTAPSIQSTIGDRGEISGNFSEEDVHDLVGILNAGSLPAAIRLVEELAP